MSNYQDYAYDPETRTVRRAWFYDDCFTLHEYGVQFRQGGPVYRPDEVEIPAELATAVLALLDEIETLRAKVEAQSKALKPFLFDDMRFDPVTKWDDETKIIVSFPRKKKAIPTSWFYIEHIKNARRAAQLGKTNEH